MENHNLETSFKDSDFEFRRLTPNSPSSDRHKTSPADELFSNGRLLPHSFPPQQEEPTNVALSKNSVLSSRSNSVNSSRSSLSSGRTSWGENVLDWKLLHRNNSKAEGRTPMAARVVMAELYGPSQRWQHITPVPPVLKREDSRRRNGAGTVGVKEERGSRKRSKTPKRKKEKSGLCWRILWWFLVACRECHAMETSTKEGMH